MTSGRLLRLARALQALGFTHVYSVQHNNKRLLRAMLQTQRVWDTQLVYHEGDIAVGESRGRCKLCGATCFRRDCWKLSQDAMSCEYVSPRTDVATVAYVTHLFLSFDHTLEEGFESVLEVLDTFLFEACDLGLHKA